jgi:hypothetical protein
LGCAKQATLFHRNAAPGTLVLLLPSASTKASNDGVLHTLGNELQEGGTQLQVQEGVQNGIPDLNKLANYNNSFHIIFKINLNKL